MMLLTGLLKQSSGHSHMTSALSCFIQHRMKILMKKRTQDQRS